MGSLQAYEEKKNKRNGSRSNHLRRKLIRPTKKVVIIIKANENEVVVEIKEEDEVEGLMIKTTTFKRRDRKSVV